MEGSVKAVSVINGELPAVDVADSPSVEDTGCVLVSTEGTAGEGLDDTSTMVVVVDWDDASGAMLVVIPAPPETVPLMTSCVVEAVSDSVSALTAEVEVDGDEMVGSDGVDVASAVRESDTVTIGEVSDVDSC